jgi:phosphatidylglycerophosphate synthase
MLPNIVTALRVALIGYATKVNNVGLSVVAIAAAGLLDMVDGALARCVCVYAMRG